MITKMMNRIFKHLVDGPFTNLFPLPHLPESLTETMQKVEKGEAQIIPPVDVPEGFRGVIQYDKSKCIGCRMCIRVCPANAIGWIAEEKKVYIRLDRCTFCSQCNDACPVKCLSMSKEFFTSNYDRKASFIGKEDTIKD